MKRVSIGFLFSTKGDKVCLLKRDFPEYGNAMLLTGVGGNAEEGEGFYDAMVREFEEEAGVKLSDWKHFCSIYKTDLQIDFFKCFSEKISFTRTAEDDQVKVYDVSHLHYFEKHPNLDWLIPLALDKEPKLTIITY